MNNDFVLIPAAALTQLIEDAVKSALNSFTATLQQTPKQSNDELLTQQQTCELLNITEPTLIEWKKQNRIPYKKYGKRVYFSKQQIMNFAKDNK